MPIHDVIAPRLNVLFCGINPGLMSEATGHHFARPGNRFWPVLHLSGFTPDRLRPCEQSRLIRYHIGITNVVDRPSARADELSRDEFVTGGRALERKVVRGVMFEIHLPEGDASITLVGGKPRMEGPHLEGHAPKASLQAFLPTRDVTGDRAVAEWVVRAPRGTRAMACSTKISVSGRGISTRPSTKNSRP